MTAPTPAQARRDGLIALAKTGALSKLQFNAALAYRGLWHKARLDVVPVTNYAAGPRSTAHNFSLPDEALSASQILSRVDGYVRAQLPSTPRSVALIQRIAGEGQTVQALATTELPSVDRSRGAVTLLEQARAAFDQAAIQLRAEGLI